MEIVSLICRSVIRWPFIANLFSKLCVIVRVVFFLLVSGRFRRDNHILYHVTI